MPIEALTMRVKQVEDAITNVREIPEIKNRLTVAEAQIELIAAYTTKAPTKSYLAWIMATFSLAGFAWNVFGPSIRVWLGLV